METWNFLLISVGTLEAVHTLVLHPTMRRRTLL